MRGLTIVIASVCFSGAGSLITSGATVQGHVVDAGIPGQPLAYTNVEIRLDFDDSVLQVVQTDALGFYQSTTVPDNALLYVTATWERSLVPTAQYHDKVVRLLDILPGPSVVFTEIESINAVNPGTGLAIIDLVMEQERPQGLTQLFNEVQLTFDFVHNNKGAVDWQTDYDVPVHLHTDEAAFFDPNDRSMHIEIASIDGTGSAFDRVTVYHELVHMIHHYTHNMMPAIAQSGCACHSLRSEEDVVCAFQEAWASYVGQLVAEFAGVMSGYYTLYRDPGNINWRGGGTTGCGFDDNTVTGQNPWTPTAYDNCPFACQFESGEIVEGAVGGAFFGWHDDPDLSFEDIFRTFVTHRPGRISQFVLGLVAGLPQDHPAVPRVFDTLARHGIVYARARFQTTPLILEEVPARADDDSGGSTAEIDGLMFIRGIGTAQFEPVPEDTLAVAIAHSIAEVALLYVAADDNTASPTVLPFVDAGMQSLQFDTSAWPDDDFDLVLIAKNLDGVSDSLKPSWAGDANPLVNDTEKALKLIGTWYDKDRDPATPAGDPDSEGKVIVDNTPPRISGFAVGP
jgi:hypothetical protein